MSFTLYIANYCPGCVKVKDFILTNNVTCEIINLDENPVNTPIPIMIFPALVQEDKLIAYGCDITPYFKRTLDIA